MPTFAAAAIAVSISTLVVGCGLPKQTSKADFVSELNRAGINGAANTECIADQLEKHGFVFKRYDRLSVDDQAKIADATGMCLVQGAPPATPPTS